MNIDEVRKWFKVLDREPTTEDFRDNNAFYAPKYQYQGTIYWILICTRKDYEIYCHLLLPKSYKTKERMFDITLDYGYAFSGHPPEDLWLVLPKKWNVSDGVNKRKLKVIVTNYNQKNDGLLHSLYTRTRK